MEEKDIKNGRGGQVLLGIFLLTIGGLAIARQMVPDFPSWVFSWQMLLIAIGVFVGFRHGFRGLGWLVPIVIGSIFLIDEFVPDLHWKPFSWPVVFIVLGIIIIFGNFRTNRGRWMRDRWNDKKYHWENYTNQGQTQGVGETTTSSEPVTDDGYINTTSIFGGVHKVIVSKNFKGGKASNVFGGTELNLSQSDFEGTIELELVQLFGGTKLTVPPNWQVKSEMLAVFGGVEDKRVSQLLKPDPNKILIIKGTTIFGGLEITSY
ncbi:MAG: hypothetical protein C5B52_06765 [Bacteroidetes bacterium]|nr:MAG: hypothetical protein C5B52_06765 [Bacteroidota bacterium]